MEWPPERPCVDILEEVEGPFSEKERGWEEVLVVRRKVIGLLVCVLPSEARHFAHHPLGPDA